MESKSPVLGVTGLGAIFAIVALLFRTPDHQVTAPAAATASSDKAGDSTPQKPKETAPFAGGQKRLDAFLGKDDNDALLGQYKLDFLIATFPDPVDSHLDWLFDAQIAALLGAYARAGYVCDSFWLPWRPETTATGEVLSATDARLARRTNPGVFLFRHHDPKDRRLELCYVVGELPTSGINKKAFDAAIGERDRLWQKVHASGSNPVYPKASDKNDEDVLRIVGPTFSGSSLSLRGAMDRWLGSNEHRSVRIITGGATSLDNESTLTDTFSAPRVEYPGGRTEEPSTPSKSRIRFGSTVHPDKTLLSVFREEVVPRLGLSKDKVALLVESSTQYGESAELVSAAENAPVSDSRGVSVPSEPKDGYLRIPFPATVSSLRTAYARDWQAQANANATITPSKSPRVDLNLDEALRPRETPRLQSTLTPAMIDLMMAEMARTLESHGIRVVVLVATDVRDKLFLGEEIKKRLPDVQLVTTESNSLYLRPDFNEALRGMLVISSYPLFVRPSDWRPQFDGETEMAFSCDGAEGTYNAILMLLDSKQQLADYRTSIEDATDESPLPPVWVTAVGKSSMLPVMLGTKLAETVQYPVPSSTGAKEETAAPKDKPRFMAVGATVLFGLAIIGLFIQRLALRVSGRELSQRLMGDVDGKRTNGKLKATHRVERIALALNRERYTALLFLALTGMFVPTASLVVLGLGTSAFGEFLKFACWFVAALGALATLWKTIDVIRIARALFEKSRAVRAERRKLSSAKHTNQAATVSRGLSVDDSVDDLDDRARSGILWTIEILACVCIALLGAVYGGLTFGLAIEEWLLQRRSNATFELFFHRAASIDEGLSLLVPLFFIGAALIAWCIWNLDRVRLLIHREPFESWHALDPKGSCHACTRDLREKLFRAVPDAWSLLLCGSLLAIGVWSLDSFERSLENLAGPELRLFDWILRLGLLALLFAIAWTLYRFVAVWLAMRACLAKCDEEPSMQAYERLRTMLASPTSLDLWLPSTHKRLDKLSGRIWKHMQALSAEPDTVDPSSRRDVQALMHLTFMPAQSAEPPADEEARSEILVQTNALVSKMPLDLEGVPKAGGFAEHKSADAGAKSPPTTWRRSAEDFLALQFVEYVQWVLNHLRSMALFLLAAVILMTLLLSSYPFYPRSLFRLMFLFVVVATVGSLLLVIMQISRDPVLSRITGTEAGQVTWNRAFIMNLVVFVLIPLLTLLSSQSPEVRDIFFAWVDPLLKAVVKA